MLPAFEGLREPLSLGGWDRKDRERERENQGEGRARAATSVDEAAGAPFALSPLL